MSTEFSSLTPVPAPPIDSLTELRRQNSTLLQRDVAGGGTAKPTPGELLGFLEAAAKLGHSLEDYEQRETAQGIMDFWIASLLSAAPAASEGTRPFTLEPYDESSVQANATEAQQLRVQAVEAVKRAEDLLTPAQEAAVKKVTISGLYDWLPKCLKPWYRKVAGRDSDPAVMQRLLLHFVRLKENSTEAYSVPLADTDTFLEKEKSARGLLEQLISAGIVRKQEGAADTPACYLLTHDSLLTKWSLLVDIVTQRRSFRQLARGWDNGGRQKAALLQGGEQLQDAIDYPHKDELEAAFIEASSLSGKKFRTYATVLLGSLVCWLGITNHRLNKSLESEQKTSHLLALEVEKTKAANIKIQQRAAKAEVAQSRLFSLRELLLVAKDANGKKVEASMGSTGVKYWDWASSAPAAVSTTTPQVFTSLPPGPQTLSPRSTALVLDLLGKITPPKGDPGRPQMEIFLSHESTDTAYENAKKWQIKFAEPPTPSKDGFDFPARFPLMRRVVPDRGKVTEVRYFFQGLGKEAVKSDANKARQKELEKADPDRQLAEMTLKKLLAAGFKGVAELTPQDDHEAPEHFIQLVFAKGSLD